MTIIRPLPPPNRCCFCGSTSERGGVKTLSRRQPSIIQLHLADRASVPVTSRILPVRFDLSGVLSDNENRDMEKKKKRETLLLRSDPRCVVPGQKGQLVAVVVWGERGETQTPTRPTPRVAR